MQATFRITRDRLPELLATVFGDGNPTVYLKDSAPGEEARQFRSAAEVDGFADDLQRRGGCCFGLAIHFPETAGFVDLHRVALDPKHCEGHDFRYEVRGWGLFFLQFNLNPRMGDGVECFLSCNTPKRAEAWAEAYPDLMDPSLWNWPAVARIGRRLRDLAKRYNAATPTHVDDQTDSRC